MAESEFTNELIKTQQKIFYYIKLMQNLNSQHTLFGNAELSQALHLLQQLNEQLQPIAAQLQHHNLPNPAPVA